MPLQNAPLVMQAAGYALYNPRPLLQCIILNGTATAQYTLSSLQLWKLGLTNNPESSW